MKKLKLLFVSFLTAISIGAFTACDPGIFDVPEGMIPGMDSSDPYTSLFYQFFTDDVKNMIIDEMTKAMLDSLENGELGDYMDGEFDELIDGKVNDLVNNKTGDLEKTLTEMFTRDNSLLQQQIQQMIIENEEFKSELISMLPDEEAIAAMIEEQVQGLDLEEVVGPYIQQMRDDISALEQTIQDQVLNEITNLKSTLDSEMNELISSTIPTMMQEFINEDEFKTKLSEEFSAFLSKAIEDGGELDSYTKGKIDELKAELTGENGEIERLVSGKISELMQSGGEVDNLINSKIQELKIEEMIETKINSLNIENMIETKINSLNIENMIEEKIDSLKIEEMMDDKINSLNIEETINQKLAALPNDPNFVNALIGSLVTDDAFLSGIASNDKFATALLNNSAFVNGLTHNADFMNAVTDKLATNTTLINALVLALLEEEIPPSSAAARFLEKYGPKPTYPWEGKTYEQVANDDYMYAQFLQYIIDTPGAATEIVMFQIIDKMSPAQAYEAYFNKHFGSN